MLTINHAVLHAFDFETGSAFFSNEELDLSDRATKSYVQRHVRKAGSSADSRHGEFSQDSGFAARLDEYRSMPNDFLGLSVEIAQWFWEELRRAEDLAQLDVLVVDFEQTADLKASASAGDQAVSDAFDARPERSLCVMLLPRKQAFVHEVGPEFVGIARHDATLPSPTQKVDSYLVVNLDTLAIDFHDKPRTVAGREECVIPERFLQCSERASTREVIGEVSSIVQDVAEEYGLTAAVEVSRAKAQLASQADVEERMSPAEVGRVVFEEMPEARRRFEEELESREVPEEVEVRRGVANRLTKTHHIRTDTGIDITFPAELPGRPGYIEFDRDAEGRLVITMRHIARIENR